MKKCAFVFIVTILIAGAIGSEVPSLDDIVDAMFPDAVSPSVVICPGGVYQCPTGYTCCPGLDHPFVCCPLLQATCCSDRVHCCPFNYRCTPQGCIYGSDSKFLDVIYNREKHRNIDASIGELINEI